MIEGERIWSMWVYKTTLGVASVGNVCVWLAIKVMWLVCRYVCIRRMCMYMICSIEQD